MNVESSTGINVFKWAIPVSLLAVVIDQLSKMWALSASGGIEGFVFLPFEPLGRFIFIYNEGVSFSFATGTPQIILGLLNLSVSALLYWWLWEEKGRWAQLGIALICGGAIGNAIDRFWLPGVIDFIDIDFFPFHYFIFNLADCAISAGVVGIFIDWLLKRFS